VRRTSLGEPDGTVGLRGRRTRLQILRAALDGLEEGGPLALTVEAIAERAGVSRGTVYQYFAGREDILRELADSLESILMALLRRMGPLGPTRYGAENLRWWLVEFVHVCVDYAPVLRLWPQLLPDRDAVLAPGGAVARGFAELLRARVVETGGVPATSMVAMGVLAAGERLSLFLDLPTADEQAIYATLTVAVQCTLYPDTPPDVLAEVADGS